jgi:MFS transporter, SP family, general alpha glucoside:H+ symporter
MTSAAAISFTIGGLILAVIVNAYGNLPSAWAYKSSFVAQYGITGIAFLIWPFMPESPTWLLMHGKDEAAMRSFGRLGVTGRVLEKKMATVKLTLEEASRETGGATFQEW